ncbi:uncharacterized protein LOC112564440 isoform X1 [Pomacea canaliculata]|uniref:uncharacterized protein LOC112564440 isoform X1 n=1 Tax=Pomacea canaliculata TaxID=400727 RepID=UPI000D72D442|nr:uncharacterized protein LOC112564440 isoform X1 [Pomacea canaliculata]
MAPSQGDETMNLPSMHRARLPCRCTPSCSESTSHLTSRATPMSSLTNSPGHGHGHDQDHGAINASMCQQLSEQIDFMMKFSLELPSYVTISGHRFRLNIDMPGVAPRPSSDTHQNLT